MEFKAIGGELEVENIDHLMKKLRNKPQPIQVIRADTVAGEQHLKFAIKKAKKSYQKNPIADSLEIEILLHVAGTRQINKAIQKAGIREGKNKVAIIFPKKINEQELVNEINLRRDDSVLEYTKDKIPHLKKTHNITQKEIEAVGEEKTPLLVRENVALLDLEK